MTFQHTGLGKLIMQVPGGKPTINQITRLRSHLWSVKTYGGNIRRAKATTGIDYVPKGGRWPYPMTFPQDVYFDARFPDGTTQTLHLTEERGYEDIDGMAHIAHYERFAKSILPASGLTINEDFVVMDCACGTGYGSNYLQKTLGCRVIGVDIAAEVVQYAQKRYAKSDKLRYLHDNAEVLQNIADDSLNALISVETIEHVPDADRVLANFKRVLKPNGVLYMTSPDATDRPGTLSTAFHVQEWTSDEFETLLRRHFAVVNIERINDYLIARCRPSA